MAGPFGNSGNMSFAKAAGHPITVPLTVAYEWPTDPGQLPGCTGGITAWTPRFDENRKHTPFSFQADGTQKPVSAYATWAAFMIDINVYGGGFMDTVSKNNCDGSSATAKNVTVFESMDLWVDLVTPTTVTHGDRVELYVDPGKGFVHPFAGQVVDGSQDGWRIVETGECSSAVSRVLVRASLAPNCCTTPPAAGGDEAVQASSSIA